MNEYLTLDALNTIIGLVIVPLLGVITKFTVTFLKSKAAELEQKVCNENLNKYIGIAESAVETAVVSVNQTFVDTMKKQGTFDKDAAQESFNLAKQKALAIMGDYAKQALKGAYDDLDAWLDSKIEFYVNQSKK